MEYEPIDLKFIKDPTLTTDIKGAHPRVNIRKSLLRETNFIQDIDIKSSKKKYFRKKIHNSLDVKNINRRKNIFSKNRTNPLEPVYLFYDQKSKKKMIIGKICKNQPKQRHKSLKKDHLNLITKDIEGAQPSTSGNKFFKAKFRRQFIRTNNLLDIKGAHQDTLKKGLKKSNRKINPLNPKYGLNLKKITGMLIGDELKGFKVSKENLEYTNSKKIMQLIRDFNIINFKRTKYLDDKENQPQIKKHKKTSKTFTLPKLMKTEY